MPQVQVMRQGDLFAEVVTVMFEDREFAAYGAVVTKEHAAGYPKFDHDVAGLSGTIETSGGVVMGKARIVARWPTSLSHVSSYMLQIEATINGVRYTGRGAGTGMLWRGKRKRVRR